MAEHSLIDWTDATWNCLVGCSRKSTGCEHCYAEKLVGNRFSKNPMFKGNYEGLTRDTPTGPRWTGEIRLLEHKLLDPLKWKEPKRIFVNALSDVFHENVPKETIDKLFAVMLIASHHIYQILTKRPRRMQEYMSDPDTPGRIAKLRDKFTVQFEVESMGTERIVPLENYPNYLISDRGLIYSKNGSKECIFCGTHVQGVASKAYCSTKCAQSAFYQRKKGIFIAKEKKLVAVVPDQGEQGHLRVTLSRDGVKTRESVHRLVLSTFVRPPHEGEEGCHRDGDPSNNALPNLRWGTQSDNWQDRTRHGNYRSYYKLTEEQVIEIKKQYTGPSCQKELAKKFNVSTTQIRNIIQEKQWVTSLIQWPPSCIWLGTSIENQEALEERLPSLLKTPAAVRFVSCEPLLGPLNLLGHLGWCKCSNPDCKEEGPLWVYPGHDYATMETPPSGEAVCRYCGQGSGWFSKPVSANLKQLHWIIAGGESGPRPRPMEMAWALGLRDQAKLLEIPYFFKQISHPRAGQAPFLVELDGVTQTESKELPV